ncbi:MAG TPA: MoaD/ThiS family protein [Actinocrinis sp.]|jgi:molybdopterin converting factor small subunit
MNTVSTPMVTVAVPSALAGYAGGRTHIELALKPSDSDSDSAHMPLDAVFDQLAADVPALERRIRDERGAIRGHVNVYLDGVDIRELGGTAARVGAGATVQILAAISGG